MAAIATLWPRADLANSLCRCGRSDPRKSRCTSGNGIGSGGTSSGCMSSREVSEPKRLWKSRVAVGRAHVAP
eukprot:7882589-Alexandrium_andersonii.AAC.1